MRQHRFGPITVHLLEPLGRRSARLAINLRHPPLTSLWS